MAKILAAGEAVTWEPPGQVGRAAEAKVRYRLAVPTVRSRLAFRRRCAELGGRQVRPRQIVDEILIVLRGLAVEGEDAEVRDRHLATVEELVAEWDGFGARAAGGDFDGEDGVAALQADIAARAPLEAEVEAIGRALAQSDDGLASLYAAAQTYADVAGIAAAETFLLGWEGLPMPFRRAGERIPDSVLLAVPEIHLVLLGQHVETLFAPSEAQAKNSGSLSSSPSGDSSSSPTGTAPPDGH